jgi:hypothetical protein
VTDYCFFLIFRDPPRVIFDLQAGMRIMKHVYKTEGRKPESEMSCQKPGIDVEIILKGIVKIVC